MSGTLKYGMHIRLQAKSPQPSPTNHASQKPLSVGLYAKHNLVCLGSPTQPDGLVFKVVATGQTSSDVVKYGENVILVDISSGKVLNYLKTGTWGNGYISLAEKREAGELHTVFQCSGKAMGTPILLEDVNSSFRVTVSVVSAKDNKVSPTPLTVTKKASSNVIGGYTMRDGSGYALQFSIVYVPDDVAAKIAENAVIATTPGSPTPMGSPSARNRLNEDSRASGMSPASSIFPASPSLHNSPSASNHTAATRASTAGGETTPRSSFSVSNSQSQTHEPLRYGDRVKLFASTPYHAQVGLPGGYVGIYKKHGLAAIGPVISSADEPRFDECEFTILPTERKSGSGVTAETGELVRYSAAIRLQDQFGQVWNNKFTGTWGEGFFAVIPAKPASQREGSGEVELSFQPPSYNLMGFPVHADDSLISLDVEHSYRNNAKFNTRVKTYKKNSSQLRGGYLVCLPSHSASKPVTFRVELIASGTSSPADATAAAEKAAAVAAAAAETASPKKKKSKSKKANGKSPKMEEREKLIASHATKIKNFLRQSEEYSAKINTAIVQRRASGRSSDRAVILLNVLGATCMALAGSQFAQAINTIGQVKAAMYLLIALVALGISFSGVLRPSVNVASAMLIPPSLPSPLVLEELSEEPENVHTEEDGDEADESDFEGDLTVVEVEENASVGTNAGSNAESGDMVEVETGAGYGLGASAGYKDWNEVELPERFIRAEKGNIASARARFVKSMRWFDDNRLWTILDRPHPLYRFIKQNTHHFFAGRGKNGNCIYYERPKSVKIHDLEAAGVGYDDLLYHFVYITEYLYQVMDTDPNAKCFSVVDCTGVGLSDLTGSVADYMKKIAYITGTHYPERSFAIFCLNAPFSFRLLWNVVKGFVDPVTQKKTHIMGSKSDYLPRLRTLVDDDQIPAEYGGGLHFTPTIPDTVSFPPECIQPQFNNITYRTVSPDEEVRCVCFL